MLAMEIIKKPPQCWGFFVSK